MGAFKVWNGASWVPMTFGSVALPEWLVIRSTADLAPYADGSGGWTLPSGLVILSGFVDLGSGYLTVSPGTVLRGFANAVIMSTTTGGVIRSTAHADNLVMREFSVVCFTGPCVVLDGGIDHQLNLFFVGLIGASAGIITGWNVQSVKQCYIEAADGLTFGGTTRKVFISETPFYGITGSAIRLASTLNVRVIDIVTCFFKFDAPGVAVEAQAGYTFSTANLRGSLIDGTALPLAGLAPSNIGWRMTNNSGIADSRVIGVASLNTAIATDIVTAGVAVKVAGTTVPWSINERFSHSNGRLTYTGIEPVTVDISGTYSIASSNNQALSFYIAVNGVIIEESRSRLRIGSGNDERAGAVMGIITLEKDDYVEVWVANDAATAELTALSFTLKAAG